MSSLAGEVRLRATSPDKAILDVGGGKGVLACFLGDLRYCLAEPRANGIPGTKLPFADEAFDHVVCCHVLEHIPVARRTHFLDQLLAKAKSSVILLNPFHLEGVSEEERLKLIIGITEARWAKEHLERSLPRLADVQTYAENRNLRFECKPNGSLLMSLSCVFMDYFASKAKTMREWRQINAYLNRMSAQMLDSAEYPTAHIVYLGKL